MNARKLISVLISAVMLVCAVPVFASARESRALEFGSDGKFTVLQITDPQDDHHPAYELVPFIELAIKTTSPDLIVFTGDIVEDTRVGDLGKDDEFFREGVRIEGINGELDYAATLANVKTAADAIFAPVEAAGIPFVVTQGNNDYKSGVSNEDWLKIYASYPHCLTVDESDDEDGKIDTYLEIKKHGSDDSGFGLWMLDNGRSFTAGQSNWFAAKQTSDVPSIVFEHIPVADIGNLFEKCHIWDCGAVLSSSTAYRLNHDIANGVFYTTYTPGATTEQFTAWKDKGVVGAFFGHVHSDGYTGTWDGITLGLTYGCEFAKAGPYGFRTITLDESGSFDTELYTYSDSDARLQEDVDYPVFSTKTAGFFYNVFCLLRYAAGTVLSLLNLA